MPNCKSSYQVRAYAVSVLERADDEELQCYLLQLVQALRFERSDKSRLSHFLVKRCTCFVLVVCLCVCFMHVLVHCVNVLVQDYNVGSLFVNHILSFWTFDSIEEH